MTGLSKSWSRRIVFAALTLPLLQTGACVDLWQQALVNGFFRAANPLLIDALEQVLSGGA